MAQTSITGGNLAYKSSGTQSTTLSQTGYIGTYLTVPTGGATVNFDVNATGGGSPAQLNVVLANSNFSFNVNSTSATNYDTPNVTLPAGTYFVEAARDYNNGTNNSFTVNNLSVNTVSGSAATFTNDAGYTTAAATDAQNAATTYIDNYREGPMNLQIVGAPSGTSVQVKETSSAFYWGTSVPDNLSTYLTNPTYTSLLTQNFNSVTPENAGKWAESETASQLDNLDILTNFAQANNMRVRGHNVVWGSQQPTDINNDFTEALSSNPTTSAAGKAAITAGISNRISTYLGGTNSLDGAVRATQYAELDVYNEDYNTGANVSASTGDNYWQVMGGGTAAGGASWTAGLYNQVQSEVSAVGANTKLFTNEYNVLNNNSDEYGNWYQQNIESIRNAGGAVSGIGTEWYNTPGVGTDGSEVDPARAYSTWQNLAAEGLPLEVTEFGETAVSGANEATGLTTAMTLAFGTPQMTGFTLWGFYDEPNMYAQSAGSVLYDSNYDITAAGEAYQALMQQWTTNMTGTVGANGIVALPGNAFYGDYEVVINGQDYPVTFDSSTGQYVVDVAEVPEPVSFAPVALVLVLVLQSRRVRRVADVRFIGRAVAVPLALIAVASSKSMASVLTWDSSGSHSTSPQDGPGTWSTSALNWSTGSGSDVGWTNSTSNSATIGSNNNAVSGVQDITMGGAITLGNITFGTVNGGSYDIVGTSANTLGMTGSTPTVTVNSGVTAEIDAAIAVTGSQPDLTVAGSGTLNMNPTVEGSNYHGLIFAGTTNTVLLGSGTAAIAIPNNNSAANFDGGTLTFAASPSTDISGRITTTSSSAINIAVTNGALVSFGNPLQGSGGLDVSGSGTGSTLEMTEASGSQVGYSGSGGVNINGGTLFLTGNNNNELGSNTVTVGANGTLSSNSTKLVTTGTTTVNGTITGGSGALSGKSYGNMHLSATTFGATGAYDWKLNTAPTTAYHSGSIVNSVFTSGSLNGNSGTNFDTVLISSITDMLSGFEVNMVPTVGSGTAMPAGTYKFAIANAASGTFNVANFSYSGFTLSDIADSTLAAANNGGVNSELDNGTGQDLLLTYTIGGHNIISLTAKSAGAPSAYGSNQGTLTVSGSNSSYAAATLNLSPSVATGYVEGNGFNPATDTEIYGLDVTGATSLSTLVSDINAQDPGVASLTFPGGGADPLGSQFNVFLDFSGSNLPSGDNYLGFDLTQDAANPGATVAAVALIPEPTSAVLVMSSALLVLARRKTRA